MLERQACGVEHEPLHPLLRELTVKREVTVFVIPKDRMPGMSEMHADLVRAAGQQAQFEKAGRFTALQHPDFGRGRLAIFPYRYAPLALGGDVLVERFADVELVLRREALC